MIDRFIAWIKSWFEKTGSISDFITPAAPVKIKRYPNQRTVCTRCPHPRKFHKDYNCARCECKGFSRTIIIESVGRRIASGLFGYPGNSHDRRKVARANGWGIKEKPLAIA